MSPGAAAGAIVIEVHDQVEKVKNGVRARTPRAAKEFRNVAIKTLKGQKSPSAPGSLPGIRSGHFYAHWTPFNSSEVFGIESAANYSGYLEHGTRKMAARPFVEKLKQAALPKAEAIFREIGG